MNYIISQKNNLKNQKQKGMPILVQKINECPSNYANSNLLICPSFTDFGVNIYLRVIVVWECPTIFSLGLYVHIYNTCSLLATPTRK